MNYKLLIISALALIFASCTNELPTEQLQNTENNLQVITITATMPQSNQKTRISLEQEENSHAIITKWKAGDKISIFFNKGGAITKANSDATVYDISTDEKTAKFDIVAPVTLTPPYTIYGVHGSEATTNGTDIQVNIESLSRCKPINELTNIPISFSADVANESNIANVNASFKHLGSLVIINLYNKSSSVWAISKLLIGTTSTVSPTPPLWFYDSMAGIPYYNLLNGDVTRSGTAEFTFPPASTITSGARGQWAMWIMPTGQPPQNISVIVYNSETSSKTTQSYKSPRPALEIGKAYHLYVTWDGTELDFAKEHFKVYFSHSGLVDEFWMKVDGEEINSGSYVEKDKNVEFYVYPDPGSNPSEGWYVRHWKVNETIHNTTSYSFNYVITEDTDVYVHITE